MKVVKKDCKLAIVMGSWSCVKLVHEKERLVREKEKTGVNDGGRKGYSKRSVKGRCRDMEE